MDNQFTKAVNIIPQTRTVLQEFFGLLSDKKPVILIGLDPETLSLIKTNFPELYFSYTKSCYNPKLALVAISKSKLLATITTSLLDTKMQSKDCYKLIGILLGYPQCCIENFLKYIDEDNDENRYNASKITYDSLKSSKKLSYYCNNLLNFSTRINDSKKDNFSKFLSLNQNLSIKIENFQYLSHIPCSYDCKESTKYGKEIEKLLKKYAPEVQKTIQSTLSRPVIYFDLFEFVIFEGHMSKGVLYYQKVLQPYGLINSTLSKAIKKGNKIEIDGKSVNVYKDDSLIFTYKKKNESDGFFLDFK